MEPLYGEFEQFPVKTLQPQLFADSVPTSRPINIPANTPYEIGTTMFDQITYSKGCRTRIIIDYFDVSHNKLLAHFLGASVIRMMSQFLGSETFQKGLQTYLNRL